MSESMIPFPDKKYRIIYADPPWEYGNYQNTGDIVAARRKTGQMTGKFRITPYDGMSIEDIKKLPVKDIADKDAVLLMWITFPCLMWAQEVIQSWGFEYRTCAFTWVKRNKNGVGWFTGFGKYTRANAEICLLARRGNGCRVLSRKIKQVIDSPVTSHSKKPDIVRKRIVDLFGNLPRIELFARSKIHGWDTWGNDEKLEAKTLESYV